MTTTVTGWSLPILCSAVTPAVRLSKRPLARKNHELLTSRLPDRQRKRQKSRRVPSAPGGGKHPEPEDYPSTAAYEWACAHWDDEPGRETVKSSWYAFACFPADAQDLDGYSVEDLNRIRSKKSWQEIPGYDRAAPPARAQLRMIVDEFLYENASRKENDRVNLVIL